MSACIILDDSAPTSVKTQRGPTSAAAQTVSSFPAMAETVKVNLTFHQLKHRLDPLGGSLPRLLIISAPKIEHLRTDIYLNQLCYLCTSADRFE